MGPTFDNREGHLGAPDFPDSRFFYRKCSPTWLPDMDSNHD